MSDFAKSIWARLAGWPVVVLLSWHVWRMLPPGIHGWMSLSAFLGDEQMIIKDKPFLWICSYSGQPVLCWHHFSPAVLVPSSGSCRFERLRVVRFHRLEAYQARLLGYLVRYRMFAKTYGVSQKTAVFYFLCRAGGDL